jgi:colicin import membrane protein
MRGQFWIGSILLMLVGCGGAKPTAASSVGATPTVAASVLAPTVAKEAPAVALEHLEMASRAFSAQQHQGEIAGLLARAKAALEKKDYDAAEKAIQQALALEPTNLAIGKAQRALQAARQADAALLTSQQAVEKKKRDAEAAQKKDEYGKLMQQGRDALASEEFEKASKFFAAAAKLNPEDNDAPLLQGMADKQKIAVEREAEAARKEAQEEEKRKAQEAENEKKRQQAQDLAKKEAEAELQRKLALDAETRRRAEQLKQLTQQQYDAAMAEGQKALADKRQADAIKAFEKALQLAPNDVKAKESLKQARELKKE